MAAQVLVLVCPLALTLPDEASAQAGTPAPSKPLLRTFNTNLDPLSLSGFVNSQSASQSASVSPAQCKNACINFQTDVNFPIINQWVLSCSLTVIPNLGKNCASFQDNLEFQRCVLQVCPDLVAYVKKNNPQCTNCLSTPVANESTADRVARCSSNYNSDEASACRFTGGANAICGQPDLVLPVSTVPACGPAICGPAPVPVSTVPVNPICGLF